MPISSPAVPGEFADDQRDKSHDQSHDQAGSNARPPIHDPLVGKPVDAPVGVLDAFSLLLRDAPPEDYAQLLRSIDIAQVTPAERNALREGLQMALAIRLRLEQHQQKERGLLAVIDTAQDLTAMRDIDQVLQAIVRRTRQLVASDVGYLSIFDQTAGDFYVRATDGAFSDKFKQVRVPGEVGICGYVARHRTPYSSSQYGPDPRFSHNELIDDAVGDEGVESILGVPLLVGDRVIGVLFVGDRYMRRYVPWEVSILSTLASHASVAIENARLFSEGQAALAAASRANAQLQQQSADTQLAADTHEKLTALIARGGSLQDIVDMVAATLNGVVEVLDEGEQAICSSSDILRLPDQEQDRIHAAIYQSRSVGQSVIAFSDEQRVCRVSAINGGTGVLGSLVITTPRDLNRIGIRTFERSALVTGILLLTQERAQYAANGDVAAVLRALLGRSQELGGALPARLRQHSIDMHAPLTLLCCDAPGGKHAYLLKRLRAGFRFEATLFDEYEGMVVVLSSTAQPDALHTALRRYLASGPALTVTSVIADPVEGAAALPRAFQRVKRSLDLLHALGRDGQTARDAQLSVYAMLFDGRSATELDAFLDATLGGLRDVDRLRGTLLAYLDQGRNARATAQALGIHINTLRQRLEAVDAALGDWQEASRALEIHLALRLWQLKQKNTIETS